MKKSLLVCAALSLLLLLPVSVLAEMMYITDKVEVSVRAGKDRNTKIVGVVRTGEKVEVLATDGEYVNVKLTNGTEGWLLARFLTATAPQMLQTGPSAADLEQLKEKNRAALDDLTRLKEEKAALESLRDQQAAKIKEIEAAHESLKTECAGAIKLREELDKFRQEQRTNQDLISQLTKENNELTQNTQLMWFIFGSAAVLGGFIIGMWLQSLRNRRKRGIRF